MPVDESIVSNRNSSDCIDVSRYVIGISMQGADRDPMNEAPDSGYGDCELELRQLDALSDTAMRQAAMYGLGGHRAVES